MRRNTTGGTVHGPYRHGRRWRVILRIDGGQRYRSFATEREAEKYIAATRRTFAGETTIDDAIDQYERWMIDERGNTPGTATTTAQRLRGFFPRRDLAHPVSRLTPARCERWYEDFRERKTRRKRPRSADTRLNTLGQLRTWARWLGKRGWIRHNPFAGIEDDGQRRTGKEQLTIDEARKLDAVAQREAAEDDSAVAVLLVLYLGIRATEAVSREARDIDDGGRLLRVTRLKKRRHVVDAIEIPEPLRPHLGRLAKGGGNLFAGRDRHWVTYHANRLCRLAGVPEVGAHGLRGSLSSGLRELGLSARAIAELLGHESEAVTSRHYITDASEAASQQRARMKVIAGGKR